MKSLLGILLFAITMVWSGNLDLVMGTWLGGSGPDEATGMDMGSDRALLYSGKLATNVNYGKTPVNISGGGSGVVLRVSAAGDLLSVTRFPNTVDDIEVDPASGNVAVIGAFGTMVLNPTASEIVWSKPPASSSTGGSTLGVGRRVSIGKDGTVAALYGKGFVIYDHEGNLVGANSMPRDYANDITVDAVNRQVVLTGFNQEHTCSNPVQVAAVESFGYQGNHKWTSFGFAANTNNFCGPYGNQMADTRGMLVTATDDGYIYFAGESAGGNSIYRYNGQTLSTSAQIKGDKFHDAYNTGSNHITYYARMDKTGLVERGQFLLPRLSSGRGNTIRPKALYVDENDYVYVGGESAYSIDTGNGSYVEGQHIDEASGGFVMITNANFSSRHLWTTFSTKEYASTVYGVVGAKGISAMAATAQTNTMVTANPIQSNPVSISDINTEGFMAIWEGPTDWSGINIDIMSPTNGQVINAGSNITLQADISSEGAAVSSVEWFLDGVSVGTASSAPWSVTVSDIAEGEHTVTLEASNGSVIQQSYGVDFLAKGTSIATEIIVSPSGLDIVAGSSYDFDATVLDQYGLVMSSAPVTWSATGGTVSNTGNYTAGSTYGTFGVTATSGAASTTADVEVADGIYELIQVNFQTDAFSVVRGYLADWGQVYGPQDNGYTYGWDSDNTDNSRFRPADTPRNSTFNHMQRDGRNGRTNHYWEIDLDNGSYKVTIGSGDAEYFDERQIIQAEGITVLDGTTSEANPFIDASAEISVSDGKLTIGNDPSQLDVSWNKLSWVTIEGLDPTGESVRPNGPVVSREESQRRLLPPGAKMPNLQLITAARQTQAGWQLSLAHLDSEFGVQVDIRNARGELLGAKTAAAGNSAMEMHIPVQTRALGVYFITVRNGGQSHSMALTGWR